MNELFTRMGLLSLTLLFLGAPALADPPHLCGEIEKLLSEPEPGAFYLTPQWVALRDGSGFSCGDQVKLGANGRSWIDFEVSGADVASISSVILSAVVLEGRTRSDALNRISSSAEASLHELGIIPPKGFALSMSCRKPEVKTTMGKWQFILRHHGGGSPKSEVFEILITR